MLCDNCLSLTYCRLPATATRVLETLGKASQDGEDFPYVDATARRSDLSRHQARIALQVLAGAGLVWGQGCYGLSDNGHRLLHLLATNSLPDPATSLCNNCLREVGQGLSQEAFKVLAVLNNPRYAVAGCNTARLIGLTGLGMSALREALARLEGAGLIVSARGRAHRLSEDGHRLKVLLARPAAPVPSSARPRPAVSTAPVWAM